MSIPGVTPDEVMWVAGGAVKYGSWPIRKGYHVAQNVGMRYQNWRHKGAGETDDQELARRAANKTADAYAKGLDWRTGKPIGQKGKHWTVETTDEATTYYHHTKSTRRETR